MVQPCRHCGQRHESYVGCVPEVPATRVTLSGADEALVGNIVAERYMVGPVIGGGGTGTVFAVEHVTFARPATMKVLRPRLASSDLLSRVFHGEARAAWSVTHPCLTEVFDIGTLPDGAPFFVMERLEGETLAQRLGRDRMSIASTVDLMMQLLSALSAVHARDLLVRDLRPQNLFLVHRRGCRPLLKILDFGLARLVPLEEIRASWGRFRIEAESSDVQWALAIPHYLSPERVRGEHATEPASDLFVAAAIMYEALSGARPFSGDSYEAIVHQVETAAHLPLVECRQDISTDLSNFLSRMLTADPRNRPATAKEMQDELRSIFDGSRKGPTSLHSASSAVMNPLSYSGAPPYSEASMEAAPRYGTSGPVSVTLASSPPSAQAETSRAASERPTSRRKQNKADAFLDDTQPRGQAFSIAKMNEAIASSEELSTASQPKLDLSILDEASAANADRTIPPPPPIASSEVPTTSPHGTAQTDEEQTETTALTPELRAHVDEILATREEALPPTMSPSTRAAPTRTKPR